LVPATKIGVETDFDFCGRHQERLQDMRLLAAVHEAYSGLRGFLVLRRANGGGQICAFWRP
jgi:hypothetical protein